MNTLTATDYYLGKCKTKGCKHALRVSSHRDLQQITYQEWTNREFDTTQGFVVNGIKALALCPDHGCYELKYGKGRYSEAHKCDARCLNATGPNCECQCGGHNHGANHA